MATGPEHYQQAEQHLRFAASADDVQAEQAHLRHAEVHAKLALAAATAMGTDQPVEEMAEWISVAGVPRMGRPNRPAVRR